MAQPAVGAEANFLNHLDDVIRFFHAKHEKHYFILNLCSEKSYDPALFESRVQCIPTDEDQPPLLDEVFSFLDQVAAYMDSDPRNVFAVHCKYGTGRTGVSAPPLGQSAAVRRAAWGVCYGAGLGG